MTVAAMNNVRQNGRVNAADKLAVEVRLNSNPGNNIQ
jgi:hypothetical protein